MGRSKTKLPAFTILEVVIVMLLISVVMAMAYAVFFMVKSYEARMNVSNASQNEFLLAQRVFRDDIQKADYLEVGTDSSLICTTGEQAVIYQIGGQALVRIADVVTDTLLREKEMSLSVIHENNRNHLEFIKSALVTISDSTGKKTYLSGIKYIRQLPYLSRKTMQEIDISQFRKQLRDVKKEKMPLLTQPQGGLTAILQTDIQFPWQKQLREKYKEAFYYELGTLIQAGVDVKNALEIIISSIKDKKYGSVVKELEENLVSGLSLSDAMKNSDQFNDYEISCIRIGEETGRMEEIVVELSRFYGKKIKNKRKLISSLSYPIIVLTTAFGAVFFMLQVVVPMFADVFKQFGGQLPWLTQQVVKLSGLFKNYTLWILIFFVSLYFLIYYFRKEEKVRNVRSLILLKMPVFGDLIHKIYLARFCSSLSLLVGNSVPLVRSISMVKKMISFYPFEKALEKVELDIINGKSFHESLRQFDIFPNKLVQLIKVGEEVNQMENLLKKVSEQYNEEVEFKVQTVSGMIEPLLIIFLGLIVGVILVAMYLPMFQISNSF